MMTEDALCRAVTDYGGAVYRLALCRLQNPADAEDVSQDVFLRLLDQPADGWEGERLKAWLLRTALNRCTDLHRFRLRRPVLPLEAVPDLAAADDEGDSELWDAVARLPEKLRTVVHLYYAEDYSTDEIAGPAGLGLRRLCSGPGSGHGVGAPRRKRRQRCSRSAVRFWPDGLRGGDRGDHGPQCQRWTGLSHGRGTDGPGARRIYRLLVPDRG